MTTKIPIEKPRDEDELLENEDELLEDEIDSIKRSFKNQKKNTDHLHD